MPEGHDGEGARVHLDLRMPVDDPAAGRARRVRAPRARRGHPLVGHGRPGGQRVLRVRPAGVGTPPSRPRSSSSSSTRPTRPRSRAGGPSASAAPSSSDGEPWSWIEGARGLPVPVLGVQPGARAQDGEEPAALGREPRRAMIRRRSSPPARRCSPSRHADADWWVLADPEGNEFCAFNPAQA